MLLLAYRPRVLGRGPAPRLDLWILIALAACVVQTVPLPRSLVDIISPAAGRVASQLALDGSGAALPLTIDLAESAIAVALFGGMIAVFFAARELFDGGGVRTVARGIAVVGLVVAAVGIAQDATGDGLMYWRWRPTFERTHPFGPFVNRNHYATWAIVAVPVSIGYLIAHAGAHRNDGRPASWRAKLIAVLDGRAVLLLASAALMIVGVVLSLSRSGMLGLAAALGVGGWLAYRRTAETTRLPRRPALLVAVLAAVVVTLIVLRVPPAQIAARVSGAPVALEDRATIWRATMPVVRDFWVAGTGAGTYQTAMIVYQRPSDGLIFNQAHNHYLQVAAEGGWLLGIPIAIVLVLLTREGAGALAHDRSGMFWLRAGAASGLTGLAVQSLFETGLLTPANSILAAIAAAMLLHVPGRYGPPRLD